MVYSKVQIKIISSETVTRLCILMIIVIRSGNNCQIRNLFVTLKIPEIAVVLVVVFKSDYTTRRANGTF